MYADRIKHLPPYLFAAIDKAKQEARAKGVDVIDLSVGDPDLPTPAHIVEALCLAAKDPANHQYPSYEGKLTFRKAVADWYKRTFNVDPRPAKGGAHPDRLQGGHSSCTPGFYKSWRHGFGARSGLSGLQDGHRLCRRRAGDHAALARERVPARP